MSKKYNPIIILDNKRLQIKTMLLWHNLPLLEGVRRSSMHLHSSLQIPLMSSGFLTVESYIGPIFLVLEVIHLEYALPLLMTQSL